MASVTVYSIAKMEELLDEGVVSAAVTNGQLILTKRDGTTVDAGPVGSDIPSATDTVKGIVELATDTETIAGTSTVVAVTPFSLAARTATDTRQGLIELATAAEVATGTDTTRAVTPAGAKATYQPLDSDLTAIGGLSPGNDSIIQRKAGAWVGRTMAELAVDLAATGEFTESFLHNGTAYADADGAKIYVGPSDPGAVTNGSVWYDTTGA